MRLTTGTRQSHGVAEPRRVHALRVRDVTSDQRQTQHRLHVLLGPVTDQLTVRDDAVALSPAEQALVIQTAGELDVLQTRHRSATLHRLLLRPRSTTSATIKTRSTGAVHTSAKARHTSVAMRISMILDPDP